MLYLHPDILHERSIYEQVVELSQLGIPALQVNIGDPLSERLELVLDGWFCVRWDHGMREGEIRTLISNTSHVAFILEQTSMAEFSDEERMPIRGKRVEFTDDAEQIVAVLKSLISTATSRIRGVRNRAWSWQ